MNEQKGLSTLGIIAIVLLLMIGIIVIFFIVSTGEQAVNNEIDESRQQNDNSSQTDSLMQNPIEETINDSFNADKSRSE